MSRTAHKLMAGSGGKDAYEIDQSVMFDSSNTAYLKRTPSSAGNRRTFTWSGWVKRAKLYTDQMIWTAYGANNNAGYCDFMFGSDDKLKIGAWSTSWRHTNRLFRDQAAWYHILIAVDTTDSTAGDRIKIYVNGVQETSFSTSNNPAQNEDFPYNNNVLHVFGDAYYTTNSGTRRDLDCYLAEVHQIDGTALTPSSFGETDSTTGQWVPKEVTGLTYGTNGFYLKFVSDARGTDSSGVGNNFTTNNIDAYDVMPDTPTNNFPTWNFIDTGPSSFYQGNLRLQTTNHDDTMATFKLPSTGKWYFEIYLITAGAFYQGITPIRYTKNEGSWDTSALALRGSDGAKYYYSSGSWQDDSYGSAFSNGDIVQCAVDMDNGKIWWGDSGTWLGSGNPGAGSNQAFTFTASMGWKPFIYGPGSPNAIDVIVNFGQTGAFVGYVDAGGNSDGNGYGNFKYAVPSGFLALCSKNLPTPTIKKSSEQFNAVTYTGNGSTQNITGVGFQPDLVWIKNRSAQDGHKLTDAVRGVTKELMTHTAAAQATNDDGLTAFGTDGFSLGDDDEYNTNSENYVAWNWKAGNTTLGTGDFTQGATASTCSRNTTAGFSIVKYSGTGSATTIGHGLGAVPHCYVVKNITQNAGNTDAWALYHQDSYYAGGTPAASGLWMSTNYASTNDASVWNDTAPTSTVFTVNSWGGVNASGDDYIAYCFTGVEGFSKFGIYTGDAGTNGPFVNTGFRPAMIISKRTDTTDDWEILDSGRNTYNDGLTCALWPGGSGSTPWDESCHGNYAVDFVSNGFKLRTSHSVLNGSGGTYVYMAFAESPFKYANAR